MWRCYKFDCISQLCQLSYSQNHPMFPVAFLNCLEGVNIKMPHLRDAAVDLTWERSTHRWRDVPEHGAKNKMKFSLLKEATPLNKPI